MTVSLFGHRLLSTLKLLTDTFAVKRLHTSCYTYSINTAHFLLKCNGLAIARLQN